MNDVTNKPIPVFRNGLNEIRMLLTKRLKFFEEMAQIGDISFFGLGPLKIVLLNNSELINSLLQEHAKDIEKGSLQTDVFKPLVGLGVSTSEGEYHDRQRKLLAPAFQPRHIGNYVGNITQNADEAFWVSGSIIDLVDEFAKVTMNTVGQILFGIPNFGNTSFGKDITIGRNYIDGITKSIIPIPLNWPLPQNRRTKEAINRIDATLFSLIIERRNSAKNESTKNDLLTALIEAKYDDGSTMDNKQVRDEAITIFNASYDNISTTMAWAFYLLAQHPAIYKKVQDEADTNLYNSHNNVINLPYATQVFRETLRLYPTAPFLLRQAVNDFNLDGYNINKGWQVTFSPWVLHRNPLYFSDPQVFDPDRFSANETTLQRYSYLPFGEGSRICPGNHLALMQGPLMLSILGRRWNFELIPGQNIVPMPRTALRPEPGVKVRVTKRSE